MIAEVDQRIDQIAIATRIFRTEYTAADLRQHLMQLLIFLVVFTRFVALTTQFFHFFRSVTKDKDIVSTDMIQHLDIRTVQRTDSQRAVKRKLHVTGAGSFRPRQRNLFRQIGRRNDQLRQANAVVRDEHDFQLVANLRIVVDHFRYVIDQMNNVLRHVIGRSRLTAKNIHAQYPLRIRVGLDAVIAGDHVQHIHQLTFVFVNTFDLHIEQRFRIYHHIQLLGDILRQTLFVLQLRLMHRVINHWEITVLLQLIKQAKVGAPVTAQVFVQHG